MTENTENRYQRGLARLSEVDGAAGEAVIASLQEIAPDLARYIIEYAVRRYLFPPRAFAARPPDRHHRHARRAWTATPQLKVHIHAARNVGLSREEIVEVLMQLSDYAGFRKRRSTR